MLRNTIFFGTLIMTLLVIGVGFTVQESFAVEYGTPIEIIKTSDGIKFNGYSGNYVLTAIDSNDNVYVMGDSSDNVFKITPGGVISEIINKADDGLDGPYAVVVDSLDNVYITGSISDNVFKITPNGDITEIINYSDGLDRPYGIAVDFSGNVYVVGKGSHNAFKIDTPDKCSTSGVPCTITEIINAAGDGLGKTLSLPEIIAVDSTGNVFVMESDNVFKITPNGDITVLIDSTGDGTTELYYALNIAIDSNDIVYVAGDNSDNVFKITPNGVITEIINGTYGDRVLTPRIFAVDSKDNVYVEGLGFTDKVFKITPNQVITEIINGTGDGTNGLVHVRGIAVDTLDNVYIVGHGSENIFKITPNGDITEIINGTSGLVYPQDIVVDSVGNIYVTGTPYSDNVLKIPFLATTPPDVTAPVITLTGANPQLIALYTPYVELNATASDNVDGDISGNVVINATSVNTSLIGNYIVTYDVSDQAGNSATTETRTVNVVHIVNTVVGSSVPGCEPNCFDPSELTVNVGDTIMWNNIDIAAHTVTSGSIADGPSGDFNSNILRHGATFAFTFEGTGEYDYFCMLHPWMQGLIIVKDSSIPDVTPPIISLLGANPQTIELGSGYSELGATTDDGSPITIDISAFVDTVGSYSILYDSVDSAGNNATQVIRTVNVVDVPSNTTLDDLLATIIEMITQIDLNTNQITTVSGDVTSNTNQITTNTNQITTNTNQITTNTNQIASISSSLTHKFTTDETWSAVSGLSSENIKVIHVNTADVQLGTITIEVDGIEIKSIASGIENTSLIITPSSSVDVISNAVGIPFDISTFVFLQSFSLAAQDNTILNGLTFNNDGSKMYVTGSGANSRIYEYNLSTNFDISTSVLNQSFSVRTQEQSPNALTFNNDGSKMYVTGAYSKAIHQYNLSTNFDISTAVFLQSFSTSTQDSYMQGLTFNNDGSKMYVTGSNNSSVYEYNLSTNFDISTAVFLQSFSVAAQDTITEGMAFNNDGSKMYVVGKKSSKSIHQYDTNFLRIATVVIN